MENQGLRQRVIDAAEAALDANGSVSAFDVLMGMGWLHAVHVDAWRAQRPMFEHIEPHMQGRPERRAHALACFEDWAREQGLESTTAEFWPRVRHAAGQLQVTASNDPQLEALYRQVYLKPGTGTRKVESIKKEAAKRPELLVFVAFDEQTCEECREAIGHGDLFFPERGKTLCLGCADLDHLVYLGAGDTALTRRARKHSPLSAIVLRFNRRQRRQERQGLLVTAEAIEQAEAECLSDEEQRAARRAREAERRETLDEQLVAEMTAAIRESYPGCPADEAAQIAERTCRRGSGRVGRSAAGQALDPAAIDLAVRAHIRHAHTNYDTLLFTCADRAHARQIVAERVDAILRKWRG